MRLKKIEQPVDNFERETDERDPDLFFAQVRKKIRTTLSFCSSNKGYL